MEVERIMDTSRDLKSKDVIARMAADIEAKHAEATAANQGIGKFWEKLTPEQQEELRNFILNPALDTPTPDPTPTPQPTPPPQPTPTPDPTPQPTPTSDPTPQPIQ